MLTIYRKTAKGQAEIDTRAYRLTPRLRTSLILVDGKRNSDELRSMIQQQPEETLATLLEQGFIETAAVVAPKPRQPAVAMQAVAAGPATAPPTVPPSTLPPGVMSFEQLRRESVRAFTDIVGPMAEVLAMRMEKSRTVEELRPMLELARQIIGNSRGPGVAADFSARFLSPAA
jgi:hypothetical protein